MKVWGLGSRALDLGYLDGYRLRVWGLVKIQELALERETGR